MGRLEEGIGVFKLAADQEEEEAHAAVDGLDGIPMLDDFAAFDAPRVHDVEAFFRVAAVLGFAGHVGMGGDEIAVDIEVFDVIGVLGVTLGEAGDKFKDAFDAIDHALVVLLVGVVAKGFADIVEIMVVHEVLDEIGNETGVGGFLRGPIGFFKLIKIDLKSFHEACGLTQYERGDC